ncbi:MAG: exonuclease domain-containing protein [Bacteroidota bacterium]
MSKPRLYAIVDVETTGGRATRHRLTEIGIVLFDGEKVVDRFESLINPQTYIPAGITELTGITQEMVEDAPKFHEIAKRIVEMTQGAVFVAHNVSFDYEFLRNEFKRLGYTFSRRKLCTVRLCRKTFPGLRSYSLGNLIKHFGLEVNARHRALADAEATTELLRMALQGQDSVAEANAMINMGIKESRLPKNLSIDRIQSLPEACGVYYFYNENQQVVYVGKSTNIRKRIAQHFADTTSKGQEIQRQVADISYELTGSELVALLLENQEIKRLLPNINRAQRGRALSYAIHTWIDSAGYRRFDVCRNTAQARKEKDIISEYPSMTRAKGRLKYVRAQLELCSALTHLHPSRSACFHYHLRQCHGACTGQETPDAYNDRADLAVEYLNTVFDHDFLLFDQGRDPNEQAVVLVENGKYCGFTYLSTEEGYDLEAIRAEVQPNRHIPGTARIIQRFLNQYPRVKVVNI